MSGERARLLAQEARRRKKRREKLDFTKLCYPAQRKFVSDTSRNIIACCSRRAGKSWGIAIKLLKTGFENPGTILLYLTMSRSMGKEILYPALEQLNNTHNLGLKFNQQLGDITLPNGTKILMRGMGSAREIDKLRGLAIIAACIDEAQGFNWHLKYAIQEVIEPAMIQFGDKSWLALTGTPNAAASGPFFDMVHEPDTYSVHHWTLKDNDTIPNVEAELQRIKDKYGFTEDSPKYRREYLGEWVRDSEGSAFALSKGRNIVYSFPEERATDWKYVLGVDLGINDPCAFVLGAYSRQVGECYVLESEEVEVSNVSESAVIVERYMSRYDNLIIVADSGGIGKAFVTEWATIYQVPVIAAQKTNKAGKVALVNADLQAGKLKIIQRDNQDLCDQLTILQWDQDILDRGRHVYARGFRDHLADALQYMHSECQHHYYNGERLPDQTPEARLRRQAKKMEEAQIRRVKEREHPTSNRRRWFKGLWS